MYSYKIQTINKPAKYKGLLIRLPNCYDDIHLYEDV